jgi:hypothetical protein
MTRFLCALLLLMPAAEARSTRCSSCARTSNGRIARSSAAKRRFERSHPCPVDGSDQRGMSRIRYRSQAGFEAWRRRRPEQYGMADKGRGAG